MVREQDVKKPRKVGTFEVAFTSNGDLCSHSHPYMKSLNGYVWETNKVFTDTLDYDSFFACTSGNSRIVFKSLTTGRKYGMFMTDFDEVLKARLFVNNKIIGNFCFCKKGSAQGIRLIFEEP